MSDAVVSGSVDKRQKIKKDQAAEHRRKYDSRRIYLGNSWDEWERQRAIFGKSHSLFAAHLLERQAAVGTCPTCLPPHDVDAPIITDCDR